MFSEFRFKVKKLLKDRGITYARLSELTGFEESTIKTFMCGASDSRRIAEGIADTFGYKLVYSNGKYDLRTNEAGGVSIITQNQGKCVIDALVQFIERVSRGVSASEAEVKVLPEVVAILLSNLSHKEKEEQA